jgi:glycosyltransferase involved in cell wall biosynthesis
VKGHLDLIAAAERMLREDPELQFVFVGGEDPSLPGHASEVKRAATDLRDHAHFLGHRDEALELMAGLDVGVLPSHRDGAGTVEALPLTALEMMAVGTPVVAYSSGGIPEALGDCGVLVPTGDATALADALARLVSDAHELGRMSECGRARAREHFSVDRMVDAMRAVYTEVGGS